MNPLWLMRMARWARHPPSATRLKIMIAIVALISLIAGIEWMGWWPEWAQREPMRRR